MIGVKQRNMKITAKVAADTNNSIKAFTRVEVALCLTGAVLLILVAMPGLANTRNRSQRAACVDNLRLIGQAVQLWGVDHDNSPPWQVRVSEAGTRTQGGIKVGATWYELSWMSNQLVTPKILVCPSDPERIKNTAARWGNTIGGYGNAQYRNNATSYGIGLHSYLGNPASFLAADRNLRVDSTAQTCSLGINGVSSINSFPISNAAWTNSIHGLTGNVLTADGRVLQMTNPDLKPYLQSVINDDNGGLHLLIP